MSEITVLDQNNAPTGPFTRLQIAEKLQSGEITLESLAFVEGLTQWTPLREVMAKLCLASPVPPPAPIAPAAVASSAYSYAATMQPPGHLVYAGFWMRFVAYIIDGLIIGIPLGIVFGIVGVVIGVVVGAAGGVSHSGDPNGTMSTAFGIGFALMELVIWALTLGLSWLYFAKLESGPAQATFGKRILGLKVTSLSGERITFGNATGRFFGKIVSGMTLYIGFIMAGFTEKKQALHDILAGTLVVKN